MMTRLNENELIQKTLNGNNRSFSLLVDRYKDFVFSMAVQILKNEQLAEEVAQDSFVRAYRALKSFKSKSKFSTWLYRITYNVALNALKKENRHKEFFSAHEPEDYMSYAFSDQKHDTTLDSVEQKDLKLLMREAIAELPSKFGTVLVMYHLQQMKYGEIAEITDIPIGTVKSLILKR